MKRFTFILFMVIISLSSLMATDVVVNNFESGSPTVSVHTWGGSYANVSNPNSSGLNTTANCGKIGRTGVNFYEAVKFTFTAGYSVPATEKRYIHMLVNCSVQANVDIQVNQTSPYVAPINQYTANSTWQDIVFEVIGGASGTTISSLYIFGDIGTGVNSSGVLNNSTKFLYVDEIIINDDFKPRGVSTADYTISTFETAMSAPVSSYSSFTTSSTWSIANPAADALNGSAKCYQVIKTGSDFSYSGLTVNLNGNSVINSSNQYLHVMVYKTVASQIAWQYKKSDNTQIAAISDNSQTNMINAWTDYVLQIPIGTIIKNLSVEIPTATGTFYMDNMVLNNNPLPRGGFTYITDNNIHDFETPVGSSTTIRDVVTFSDANNTVTYPVSNPINTYANTTSNCGKRNYTGTSLTWYAGFGFTLNKPMLIDASHKYLHVQMLVPTDGQQVAFGFKQGANILSDVTKTVTKANVWQDIVVDLSAIPYLTDVYVKCGIPVANGTTATGDYYFDEIKVDGNSTSYSDVAINVTNGNPTMGSISGAGTYTKGVSTTVTATPNAGYRFVNWTLNTSGGTVQSTSASYSFTVMSALTLVANFVSISTDNFRSKASGNWGVITTWQSSPDNSTWYDVNAVPTSSASSINILSGHEVTITANATSPVLTINTGGKLTLNSGYTLGVTGNFTIDSDGSSHGTFVDANTIGGLTVSGSTTVNQHLNVARNWYISSPIYNSTAPSGYTYYKYHESGDNNGFTAPATAYWENIGSTPTLARGIGYIANLASSTATYSLSGSMNTGDVPLTLSRSGAVLPGFNLVGNPYPSFLDISSLASNSDLVPTYWVRSKNGSYVFDTYNIPGGMSTGLSGFAVTSKIAPMQAFWLRVKSGSSSASVTFTNAMRTHQDDANNKFRAPSANALTQQVLRLQVSNGIATDATVMYSNSGASNAFDVYDSQKMTNSSASIPEIYTLAGGEQLTINGLNSIPCETEFPIGFTTGQSNTFSILVSQFSNFDAGTRIILKDYADINNPVITDLTDGSSYSFISGATSNNTSRFTLTLKAPSVATGVNSAGNNENMWISTRNGQIVVNGTANGVMLEVFNAVGQKVISKKLTGSAIQTNNNLPAGAYLVKVSNEGKSITRKIIID